MWIKKPFRNEEQCSVDVMDAWEVRWNSRSAYLDFDTSPEVKIFKSKGDAETFKLALIDAFKLTNNIHDVKSVTIGKSKI